MSKDKNKWMSLGVCRKAHGIKGAFHFHLHNTEDSVLENGTEIHLVPLNPKSSLQQDGENFIIADISFGNKVIAYLEGIEDRNSVEAMLPFEIYIDRKFLPKLEEGEYYLQDLMNLTVVDVESDNEVGKIRNLLDNGVQTILEVRGKMNFEIPLVDAFVKKVDFEHNKIYILLPDIDE
ncbi:MAG: hypothetical protein Fur0010_21540 [Bdellovibrio sp.]